MRKSKTCNAWEHGIPCENPATFRMIDPEGRKMAGMDRCETCAKRLVGKYLELMGQVWKMEKLEG